MIGPMSGYDFDHGYDEFFPDSISPTELGAAVKASCSATRILDWDQVDKPLDMKKLRKKLQQWHRLAFLKTGASDLAILWHGCQFSVCKLDKANYLFSNGEEASATDIAALPNNHAAYQETICPINSPEDQLGAAAVKMLGCMVTR